MDIIALLTIFVPFLGAIITVLVPRQAAKWVCQLFAALASLGTLILAAAFFNSGETSVTYQLVMFSQTEVFGLTIDKVSTLIAVAVVVLGLLVSIYSLGYMTEGNREHPHEGLPRYYAFLLIFIGAMAGLVLSSTILGQLLFFEITGACSWSLIGYYQKPTSLKAALKALLVTHVASIGLFVAAAFVFKETGTFSLSALASLSVETKTIVFLGIMMAAWGKSAQLPLHVWLPDAMNAPTPVSAYLHAASMVKVGVYIFARAIMSGGDIPEVIGVIGVTGAMITLIYGFIMYLPQTDMKRLLAYSTITQLAYIFLALSLSVFGSDLAFEGGVTYIFNHAFAKSLFFLVAGALSYTCGTRMLPALRGIVKKSPLLAVGFCVAALAITGVPPFNGFFSKFPLFAAGFNLSSEHSWLMPVMILALVESVASFGWILYWFGKTVVGEPSEAVATAKPLPRSMSAVLIILIIMSFCSSFIASNWLS
ncbi:hydrogenase 4 subunit D [Photobacterium swingsii]|uniref:Hydrogenase 4 subunit D n=1 Tax=Photobacterium swingsii TaxID=680026 RepID=A0A0J8VEF3_9GAMM|nr:hydrogenase 4 subunit D [Photobacterium swingsii]KMV31482.1 hydrogenase 4 subunit D [Photobacterium swingsii]PSW24999.1 hydrogenase 4 subunit D [Photobacterium swingsii]